MVTSGQCTQLSTWHASESLAGRENETKIKTPRRRAGSHPGCPSAAGPFLKVPRVLCRVCLSGGPRPERGSTKLSPEVGPATSSQTLAEVRKNKPQAWASSAGGAGPGWAPLTSGARPEAGRPPPRGANVFGSPAGPGLLKGHRSLSGAAKEERPAG